MKLLDTNIVLYAAGRPHRYKGPCGRLMQEVVSGIASYTINTELLQEVLHTYISRGERARALTTFDDLLTTFPYPIPISRDEIAVARQLLESYQGLSPRDAIHAAVVITQGLEGIVTTDRAFHQISGLVAYDPTELASG